MPAAPTSAARIAANRANALLSTGPRTTQGKERARANAVRHGLAGAGIALPTEDEAVVAERFLAIQEELAPRSMLGVVLAHQVALMSVRLQRAALQESAALARRVRHAAADYDEARCDEVDALMAAIEADPARSRRKLLALPEGVDRLIEALLALKADLDRPGSAWDPTRERLLAAYCGRRPLGSAESVAPIARIDAEVAELREHLDQFDFEAIELDRAEAGARALFDPGREATLARRYEAAAHRGLFRALREFHAVEAAAEAQSIEERPEIPPPSMVESAPASAPSVADPVGPESSDGRDWEGELGSFGSLASGGRVPTDRGGLGGESARSGGRSAASLTVGAIRQGG